MAITANELIGGCKTSTDDLIKIAHEEHENDAFEIHFYQNGHCIYFEERLDYKTFYDMLRQFNCMRDTLELITGKW